MPTTFSIKQAAPRRLAQQGASEKPPVRLAVGSLESTTVHDLKKMYLNQIKKSINLNRVRLTIEDTNETLGPNEKALSTFGSIKDDTTLIFKDLGPQISWKSVFLVEYFFPMVVFPLIWLLIRKFPSNPITATLYGPIDLNKIPQITKCWQDTLALMFTLHFVKREYETMFIHRFGNDTMPLTNIFKNSGYYWLFAFWIAYITMHPLYTMPECGSCRWAGVGLFVVSELLNLKAHIDLRNLRPAGTRIRRVPQGILFKYISCPNYFFEILSWIGFTMASKSVAAAAFTLVGALQMTAWAVQKHKRYRKEFDGVEGRELYPRNRKILIPFIF
jgi:very-long-chain enoyl-CoA reductase